MDININFNFYSETNGKDPDIFSPTLKKYHKTLWSKKLPNDKKFYLSDDKKGVYLYHQSELGSFFLGSDAITHSYKNHKRKEEITKRVLEEVNELFNSGSTIGSYIIFPNNKVDNKHTINQARGINKFIDDRFDLTLECIRLFYLGKKSPLYDVLLRYKEFFKLFVNFKGYVEFFLLQDLIDEQGKIKFYLPFDGFKMPPTFYSVEDYKIYKERVLKFINARNKRISNVNFV